MIAMIAMEGMEALTFVDIPIDYLMSQKMSEPLMAFVWLY